MFLWKRHSKLLNIMSMALSTDGYKMINQLDQKKKRKRNVWFIFLRILKVIIIFISASLD